MKTIKYTVDRGFRTAGEVRLEEDGIADNLILRGFAEETDEDAGEGTGDGSAVDQYDPEGSEADPDSRGGAQSLPAELNAPGVSGSNTNDSGSNARAPKGKAAKVAADTETTPKDAETEPATPSLSSEVSVGDRTEAEAAEKAEAPEGGENQEHEG